MENNQKEIKSFIYANTEETIGSAQKLVIEYAKSLGCSPCLHNIEKELHSFPLPFAPPDGRLILALFNNEPVGVLGVRKISNNICEMARLYIKPAFRTFGLGKGLAEEGLAICSILDCQYIRLYTLPLMTKALAIYQKLGFKEIEPYTDHSIEGAIYLQYDRQEKVPSQNTPCPLSPA